MSDDKPLTCPWCMSADVTVTEEQTFMVNSGEHYCHSVKSHDFNAKVTCIACKWEGKRMELIGEAKP